MSDVVQATVKAASSKLSDFFKNTAGQFSVEEVSKFLAVVAAVALGVIFFVTPWVPAIAAPYVLPTIGTLLAYALGQGIAHNATGQ